MGEARERWRSRGLEAARQMSIPASSREVARREVRDPTAATQPVSTKYLSPGAPMISEWDADQAVRLAFYSNVIVYRCMQILADTVAGCPFRAGPRPPSEPGAAAEHNPNARLAQLLGPPPGGPAPKLTARRLWSWSVVQRKLTGRHGWEIETADTNEVVALWPLVSSELKAIPSRRGAEWWDRFEYGKDPDTKEPRKLDLDHVVYGWNPAATDFRQPESCLQAARLDVSVAVMMGRYNHSFLRNDARPAAVVVTEAFASDEDFWRFKSQWNGNFGGPDNAGKIAFLEIGDDENAASKVKPVDALNVQVLGLSQKDARFIEQEKAALERVAIACGVPWSRLSATERTFNNAGQEDENFWFDTMIPLLTDLADEVNMQLAPRLGGEVGWFDLGHVKVFKPTRSVLNIDPIGLFQAGLASKDEARELVKLPAVDGGDVFASDLQAVPALPSAAQVTAALPAAASAQVEHRERQPWFSQSGESVSYWVGGPGSEITCSSPQRATTIAPAPPSAGAAGSGEVPSPEPDPATRIAEEQEQRRSIIWKANDATVRTLEKQWQRALHRLFARQQRTVISRLEGNRGRRVLEQRANADDIFDRHHWLNDTFDEVLGLFEAVTGAGFSRMAQMFGIDFDLEAPYAQKFIASRANQLAGQVTDTTYGAIKDALAAGVQEGESIPQIADRVRNVFDVASTSRSEMIARTEVNSAYGGSTRLAGDQLPQDVLGGYEWVSTRDARTRDDHAAADGQVIVQDATFDVGGEPLQYPGDPSGSADNVINCRCTLISLTPDEMAARSGLRPVDVAAQLLGEIRHGDVIDELALRRRWLTLVA